RHRYGDKDNGLDGAVIGGVLGGVAGNVIAGEGSRTIGTVVGATVGAVAGAAIDKGEDQARTRDFCEDYLTRYEGNAQAYGVQAYGGSPYAGYPYGSAYSNGQVMWMPVVVGWNCKPREKVVEEWVEERPARRVIPAKTKYVPVRKAPAKTKPIKWVK
ncbi:MAG TPA: glycine zipper 2TM domain-containing protein, partial [Sphingomonadaceae bacterium]|nr:glycine zipper 2TM domain-containing protein [Sphingomonadaceae bacterium]